MRIIVVVGLSLLLLACAQDLPSWVPSPGMFTNISLNFMKELDPCPSNKCVYSPNNGQNAVFQVWNGGAYVADYSQYGALVVHGGGHNGYSGNEAYAFDITTRLWHRIKYPSNYTENQADSNGEYPDGQPFPPHTYTGVTYLSKENGGGPKGSFLRVGHGHGGVASTHMIHKLPLDTSPDTTIGWSRLGVLSSNGLYGAYWSVTYDERRRRYWVIAGGQSYGNGFGWVSITGNVTMLRNQGGNVWSYTGMVYSSSLDMLVHIGYNDDDPYLKGRYAGNETMGFQPILWTGTFPKNVRNFEWSSMGGYYVCYEGAGSYIVHKLVPPEGDPFTQTWTWVQETLTGVDGAVPTQVSGGVNNGIWSRFREVPVLSTPGNPTFVFADGNDQPVQLWRLSGTPPPQANIPITPAPPLGSPSPSSQSPSSEPVGSPSPSPQSPSVSPPSSTPRSSNLSSNARSPKYSSAIVVVGLVVVFVSY